MKILSPEIQEFIRTILKMNTVGCLTVPRAGAKALLSALQKASALVGTKPAPGRAMLYPLGPKKTFPAIAKPAILIVAEEDYSAQPAWREKIRDIAEYFLNVAG